MKRSKMALKGRNHFKCNTNNNKTSKEVKMAPRGRIYKRNTFTRETVSATHSINYPNKCTFAITTDNISRIINGQRKTRGEGLNKIKRYLEKNVVVEIPNGKWRSVKAIQSAKLSNHLGIVAQYFLTLPNQGKELKIEEKDAASQTEIDEQNPKRLNPIELGSIKTLIIQVKKVGHLKKITMSMIESLL
uniref:Uncharacterized protein n=1 Tax=Solanum lycopersicum TaxID=4081 RepID=K4AVU6_SOLLC